MSVSLVRRGLELFNDDVKGEATIQGAKLSLANLYAEGRCLFISLPG